MHSTQQHSNPRKLATKHSVLDGQQYIAGVPSDAKSPVERARDDKRSSQACKSVFDGPECIGGC